MNFLKNTVMGIGSAFTTSGVGGLPFSLIDSVGDVPTLVPEFQLLKAKSKHDGTKVSVFKSQATTCSLSQNALRRIKTIRHPNVLAYIDGTEVANGNIFIVTEEVTTLRDFLDDIRARNGSTSEEESIAVSWGLRAILSALKFINMDCKMIHGRIHPESIFVTKGGDWKLAGFQVTGEQTLDGPYLLHHRSHGPKSGIDQDPRFKAPECTRGDWNGISSGPSHAIDMFAFASTVVSLFNPSFSTPSETRGVPSGIGNILKRAIDPTPSRRITPGEALQVAYFESKFIQQMSFLEQLAIKSSDEKSEYYKDLVATVDKLPQNMALYKVLPALKAIVEFGVASGSNGKAATYKLDPSESQMLPAMLPSDHFQGEEFKEQVLPTLVKLFGCNDRAVRVQLLQMMDSFAAHFDSKLVNSTVVFDNICTGFNDTMPLLRELTMKSMLHIADKLSDSNLNNKLMKYFAKLQVDPEPAIRTNTTICLGKMAVHMNAATRGKVLLPAFCRALKDPFPHARMAGLRTLVACDEYFSPHDISQTIIPSISPLMLDVSPSVRDEAIGSMTEYMKKVQEESRLMKLRDEEQEKDRLLNAPAQPPVQTSQRDQVTPQISSGVVNATIASSNAFHDTTEDDLVAEDAWGGDDELDALASPPSTLQGVHSGPSLGHAKTSVSISSLNLSTSKPSRPADPLFFDDWGATSNSSSHTTSMSSGGAGPFSLEANAVGDAKPRKSLQERKLEGKSKKEPLGAMKLASKPKGGDNWDWDM
ncbi:Aste57867_25495 [Aphanomyces stellatus]|uniref:Aste57867_25495 protein n=1 Tax=Aphanomyces stellatus TaxID=120398 RepID=A0A485LVQ8_9STRA|nr:hypothetical protein As57867_025416 [Aphanomyces stellatus]VFU02118.1 Aste57867_25495 [Aphanomyces stellatus]